MKERNLSIYVHIPFCARKCRYCDFLSFPASAEEREAYVRQLIREITCFPKRLGALDTGAVSGRDGMQYHLVPSIFIGGGTPSVLSAEQIDRIMTALRDTFPISDQAEITMECNPGTDVDYGALYRAGINRISLGVQSTDNAQLRLLGRIHTWEDAVCSFHAAKEAGFTNRNIDLIFSLPGEEGGQTLKQWTETLQNVLWLRPEHISAYSLMIEEGTPFYQDYAKEELKKEQGKKSAHLPDEDTERDMYHTAVELLKSAGYEHYEISNFALPGFESVHNNGYWQRREYAGFGLGAASLIGKKRYRGTSDLARYLSLTQAQLTGPGQEEERLSVQDEMSETMFLGLRRMEGVDKEAFRTQFGKTIDAVWPGVCEALFGEGLLREKDGKLQLTEKGIDLSNQVFLRFF